MNNSSEKSKRIMMVALICAGILVGYFASFFLIKGDDKTLPNARVKFIDKVLNNDSTDITIEYLENQVQAASDLVTTKYYYTDADSYEDYKNFFDTDIKIPFTTEKAVFTYDGVISVGVDVSKIKYDLDNDDKKIKVKLPELEIISNEIDDKSFEIVDEAHSLFNPASMKDFSQLVARLKEEKQDKVLGDERFMENAEENSEDVIRAFLTASPDLRKYEVEFE